MNDDERRRAAQAILDIPLFNEIWDDLERAAINATLHADYADHEKRQAHAAEARAIRRVRERLNSLAKQPDAPRNAPA